MASPRENAAAVVAVRIRLTGEPVMAKENVRKLGDVLRSLDQVMLTTIDQGGRLVSRPMALRVEQFNGSLLLFAPVKSRVIANISRNPKINISYAGAMTSLSIAGTATYTQTFTRVCAHWHHGLDPWFPRGAANAALIEITVDEARFWTALAPAGDRTASGQLSEIAG
jgi:general stress protein 26